MMFLSIFFWLFIGLSLVVCFALTATYEYQPDLAVRTALGITLLLAILGGLPLSFLLRKYSPRVLLRNWKELTLPGTDMAARFARVRSKVGVEDAELRISKAKLPVSFVAEVNRPVVVISEKLIALLNVEEVEAVMAHELAHVKNSDTSLKALVTAYKTALPQDPIIRLIEAAFHREREMCADETAVEATEKPLSLASALLKIHRASAKHVVHSRASLSILNTGSGPFHRHPLITDRINQLVRLAQALPA
jgi:Zn-dependent protease with chaperone function